jgi:hypothetical protein
LFTKNSCWQAEQPFPLTTLMFYGDCVKMCEDFAPKFGDKRTACCITTTYRLTLNFSPGNFFYQKQHNCRSHPPHFCLIPQLKIKLKGSLFDTTVVIEA